MGGHPAQALLLEVVLVGNLLVIDVNIRLVVDIDFLLEQEGFQFTVLASGRETEHVLTEPLIVKAHARAYKG